MNSKLTKKLILTYPLLYGDFNKSPQETLMCFGFECGDGWFDIINSLSSKIEKEIERIVKNDKEYELCRYCGNKEEDHPKEGKLKIEYKVARRIKVNYSSSSFFGKLWFNVATKINYVNMKCNIVTKKKAFECPGYENSYPRAFQVKEKYGTLRLNMSCYPDNINKWIEEAEEMSENVCEICGKKGKLRTDFFYVQTLCPVHYEERIVLDKSRE